MIIVGVGPDSVSKLLDRIMENAKERDGIDVVGLLSEFVAEKQNTSKIEFELKMLDLPSSFESNEIILSNPVMADRHQIIELRKPIRSENKATKKMMNKGYFRRKK